jgi:hypothetical protein
MWDSSGKAGVSEPEEALVDYDVAKTGESTYELTLSPDVSWLRAKERVYPVFVDPTMYLGTGPDAVYGYKSDGVFSEGTV